jgi:protein-histidine pros-kinase
LVEPRVNGEEKFRSLLESAPDAMVIVDRQSRIVLVNGQTERLFGYDRSELLGQSIEILVPDRYRNRHVGHREQYQSAPKVRPMGAGAELFGKRKDGSEFPVEISLSPLETEEGKLVSSSIRDISARKQVERELKDKNAELEQASQAKDRFLATMSHELRTPLNAILGFTGVLLMGLPGPLTQQQESQLRTVENSGRHLLSLINDLLDLARIQSGKLVLDLQPVPLAEALQEVTAALTPLAQGKGLDLTVELPTAGPILRTDRRALCQVLLNLTNNAIKFTPRGSVRIRYEDGSRGPGLHVTDTGVGIADAELPRLFSAFEQLPSAAGNGEQGSGLGLHLSQKLAELLGGSIECRSRLGEGSTFTLWLGPEARWPSS